MYPKSSIFAPPVTGLIADEDYFNFTGVFFVLVDQKRLLPHHEKDSCYSRLRSDRVNGCESSIMGPRRRRWRGQ